MTKFYSKAMRDGREPGPHGIGRWRPCAACKSPRMVAPAYNREDAGAGLDSRCADMRLGSGSQEWGHPSPSGFPHTFEE